MVVFKGGNSRLSTIQQQGDTSKKLRQWSSKVGRASTVLTLGQGKVLPWWRRGGKRMDGTPAPTIAWELRDFIRWLQEMTAPLSPAREVIFFYFAIFHYVVRSFSRFASASPYSLTYGISRTPNNFLVPQLRAENHHKRPTVFSYPSSTLRSISLYFLSPCLNFRAALGCHRGRIGLDSLMWPSGVLGLAHELGMAAMFMNEWVLSGGLIKDGVHISAKQHSEGYVFIGE